MFTTEDISCLNDNEINGNTLFEIKKQAKKDVKLLKKIRLMRKISYLTRNIMERYKNRLFFDLSKKVIKEVTSSQPKHHYLLNKQ